MKEQISIRLDDELLQKLRDQAKEENRPLSNVIETTLLKSVDNATSE